MFLDSGILLLSNSTQLVTDMFNLQNFVHFLQRKLYIISFLIGSILSHQVTARPNVFYSENVRVLRPKQHRQRRGGRENRLHQLPRRVHGLAQLQLSFAVAVRTSGEQKVVVRYARGECDSHAAARATSLQQTSVVQ